MILLKDGENVLGKYGATTILGRDRNCVQILITCGSEEEAIRIIQRALEDINTTGQTTLVLGGSVDETEIARAKQ